MLKNVNSQIGQGSQNETKKTPDISHLTGIAKSFHFKSSNQKPRFRIIFGYMVYWIVPVISGELDWGKCKGGIQFRHYEPHGHVGLI